MWLTEFRIWSLQHAVVALLFSLAIVVLCAAGRSSQPAAERRLRLGLALSVVALKVVSLVWWFLPAQFRMDYSLPIHVCDVVGFLCPFALLLPWRMPKALVYFWGLGLSVQAFVFPPIVQGPDSWRFWLYWLIHAQVIAVAAYLPSATGYRPQRRDLCTAIVGILVYNAAMAVIDIRYGWDYGYMGPVSTVVGWLGPWPFRAFLLAALELTAVWLLWLPWRRIASPR